jgi:hypothetical protein
MDELFCFFEYLFCCIALAPEKDELDLLYDNGTDRTDRTERTGKTKKFNKTGKNNYHVIKND